MTGGPWDARVEVPDRAALIEGLAATNRRYPMLMAAWVAMGLLCTMSMRWSVLAAMPWQTVVVAGLALGPFLASAAVLVAGNHKAIEALDASVRFGPYDRAHLWRLVDNVCASLRVPRPASVRVSRDTSLNASAVQVGLGWLFPALDAVYLHRQMLHVLSPGELASVVGHELAHLYRHKVRFRFETWLHLLVATLIGWWVIGWLGDRGGVEILGALVAQWGHSIVLGWVTGGHDEAIEFLCDDAGAQAAGVLAAINAEIKIAVGAETTVRMHRTLRDAHQDVPLATLLAAYEEAVPFGTMDEAELAREVASTVSSPPDTRGALSLRGYLAYLSGDEDGDGEDAQGETATLADTPLPVLAWDRSGLTRSEGLSESEIAALCDALTAHPDQVFVDVPWEVHRRSGAHPNATRRILFLWRHRAAIEADAAQHAALSG